jgi:glutaredoxin
MKLYENEVTPASCPYCKEVMDRAAGMDEEPPSPGMLAICIFCASLSQYDDDMQLVPVAREVWAQIKAEDPEFAAMVELSQKAARSINRRNYPSRTN